MTGSFRASASERSRGGRAEVLAPGRTYRWAKFDVESRKFLLVLENLQALRGPKGHLTLWTDQRRPKPGAPAGLEIPKEAFAHYPNLRLTAPFGLNQFHGFEMVESASHESHLFQVGRADPLEFGDMMLPNARFTPVFLLSGAPPRLEQAKGRLDSARTPNEFGARFFEFCETLFYIVEDTDFVLETRSDELIRRFESRATS